MDFGDIIYVVIALVFSAAGALGKRKKKQPQAIKPSRMQDVFNSIFEEEVNDDPVQQVETYTTDEHVLEEEEVEGASLSLMEEYQSLIKRDDDIEKAKENIIEVVENEQPPKKPHHLLADLKSHHELQKALVYSEVLKPKFKTL